MKLSTKILQELRSWRYERLLRNYDLMREPDIYKMCQMIEGGDTVIDIGACVGLFTYNMSLAVGDTGQVVACEPMPLSNDVLKRNMRRLKRTNVTVLPYALSNERLIHSGHMHIPKGFNHYYARLSKYKTTSVGTPVCVTTFDSAFLHLTHASFIKVDTEGNEAPILRGAHEFLANSKAVWLVEINKAWWEIKELFTHHGYRPLNSNTENCFFVKGYQ